MGFLTLIKNKQTSHDVTSIKKYKFLQKELKKQENKLQKELKELFKKEGFEEDYGKYLILEKEWKSAKNNINLGIQYVEYKGNTLHIAVYTSMKLKEFNDLRYKMNIEYNLYLFLKIEKDITDIDNGISQFYSS